MKVFIFDGTSLAYRAFYAIKSLSTSYGFPTNAVFGFVRMFLKLYKELKPEYILVAFDAGKETFRNEISKNYKANRKPMPDTLKPQIPFMLKFLECFGVKVIKKKGFEADDIIGTVSKKLSSEGHTVIIVTPDKDMKQLIDKNISVLSVSGKAEKMYTLDSFIEEYGIKPTEIPDAFGISGDHVDNIPGVPGMGEKTALKLVQKYHNLEKLYQNLSSLSKAKRELLERYKENAFLSRKLARIDTKIPMDISINDLKVGKIDVKCLLGLIKKLEIRSVVKEIVKAFPNVNFEDVDTNQSKKVDCKKIGDLASNRDLFTPLDTTFIYNNEPIVALDGVYCTANIDNCLNLISQSNRIFTFDLKSLYHRLGDKIKSLPFFDLSICEYILNPLFKDYSARSILQRELNLTSIDSIAQSSGHISRIGQRVIELMKKNGTYKLYTEIEHPLSYVLYAMEKHGVLFDKEYLIKFKDELQRNSREIEEKIFNISGEKFNLNSPKQLSKILFENLSIKPIKKTKSGYSTNVEVLTALALKGYDIAKLILTYRKLTKLSNTFVDGILNHMDENDRVHTTFMQTATATGRLSSVEPNLQNLPTSDELSENIRHALIAPHGFSLVWADYSQVELRVLAHLSKDEKLIEAYQKGIDIHRQTASQLFDVSLDDVTDKMRKFAKTVNFGVIYGMTPQGLSQRLNIPVGEAKSYINRYFERFKGVRLYIDKVVEEAYENGYVRTLFNRVRPLPELKSSNKNIRNFGERAAVNAVIQGTAADIMKIAMIKLFKELKDKAFMVLQVHDEIVIESPNNLLNEVINITKKTAENAVKLDVPLTVDISSGKHWE